MVMLGSTPRTTGVLLFGLPTILLAVSRHTSKCRTGVSRQPVCW
jgi:hypothetical protein